MTDKAIEAAAMEYLKSVVSNKEFDREVCLREASKIIKAYEAAKGDGWRPISEAPRDGRDIWLSDGDIVELGKWKDSEGVDERVHQGYSCYDMEYWVTEAGFHSDSFFPAKECKESKYGKEEGQLPLFWRDVLDIPTPPHQPKRRARR